MKLLLYEIKQTNSQLHANKSVVLAVFLSKFTNQLAAGAQR